jgi:Clustered mitochondria
LIDDAGQDASKERAGAGYSTEDLPDDWEHYGDDDDDDDDGASSTNLSSLMAALADRSDSQLLQTPVASGQQQSLPTGYTPAPWQFGGGADSSIDGGDESTLHLFDDGDNSELGNDAIDSQQLLKDWMAEYRELLTLPEDKLKFERIWKLTSDFRLAAETYARVIVSELPLPLAQKTIKPADVGGCSGDKYIVSGLLVKVLSDSVLLDDVYMFGGAAGRNDAAAVKTASLELMHSEHVNGQLAERRDFMTAMVVLIDWMGSRVLCSCLLPIDSTSLQVGSNDGGAHVASGDASVVAACDDLFASFNLKRHRIASSGVEQRSAGDVEAHLADDGVVYLLDLARLTPPEYEAASVQRNPRALFYELLRPEFVMRYHEPLCADAGTAWSERSEARAHVDECARATAFLFDEVVPRFAAELDASLGELGDGASAEQLCHAAAELSGAAFHQFGVNVRHVGRVRQRCAAPAARRRLLSVAIARALKNHVNAECRAIARQLTAPSSHPFVSIVVAQCNAMLGGAGQEASAFWRDDVKRTLDASFRSVLDDDERAPDFDLRARVNVPLVVLVMLRLIGASASSALVKQLIDAQPRGAAIMVLESDFEFKPRVKTPYLFVKAEALAHWLRALDAGVPPAARIRLLTVAAERFADIVERISWCPTLTYQSCACQVTLAALQASRNDASYVELLLSASAKLRALIYYSSHTICRYAFSSQAHATLCEQSARLARAILLHIDGEHPARAALEDHIASPALHSPLFPSSLAPSCSSSVEAQRAAQNQERESNRLSAFEFRAQFEASIEQLLLLKI